MSMCIYIYIYIYICIYTIMIIIIITIVIHSNTYNRPRFPRRPPSPGTPP